MKALRKDDPCWCNSGKKYCDCHMEFDRKLDNFKRKFHKVPPRSIIKNEEQLAGMRESSKINIAVLDYVAENIHAGMTTQDIDDLVYQKTTGFPSKDVILKSGDIVNVDCSTILHGYFSDSSRMFCIGNVAPEHKKLVDVAKECVELGLAQVKPWGHLGDVAAAINEHAKANGYSVVREVGGHGIGLEFHETPFVSYVIKKGTGMVMAPGMVFTIEPMINAGLPDIYIDEGNNWTIYTDDDSYSAQWEIMVHVTEDGYEVMSY